MSYEEYTWLRYYEDLYHRQKKINNDLAVKLGETTAKAGELNVALNRVIGSPFWRVMAPARKIYGKIKGTGNNTNVSVLSQPNTPCPASFNSIYAKRLELFEDYYGSWLENDELELKYRDYTADSGRSRVQEAIYKVVMIEQLVGGVKPTDLVKGAKWIVLVSEKGILANGYAERIGECISDHPEALFGYADEDYFYRTDENKYGIRRVEPNFKPDWSPDTLDSFFYFGNISFIRSDFAAKLVWRASENPWENVYDMFLQASERVGKHYDTPEVVHISQVLFHNEAVIPEKRPVDNLIYERCDEIRLNNERYEKWRGICQQIKDDLADGKLIIGASDEYNAVKMDAFNRRKTPANLLKGQFTGINQICYQFGISNEDPLVSILILSKDHPDTLKTCITSILEKTDYSNIEFVVVDNGSNDENKARYEKLWDEIGDELTEKEIEAADIISYKYIYEEMPFNFSKGCNIAAANANGEVLLFLNDDIEAVQKDWLKLMVGYARLPHVGAVGAKLLYANTDLIQHVGITSMKIGPSHKLVVYPDDQSYYYGKNIFAHDMLGVTGACLMIEKQKFNQVLGFNEDFAVAYNDVDLCMRINKYGYTNLQCNGALLYHYESLSRGLDEGNDAKWDRLLHEKDALYSLHPEYFEWDPYYNENFVGNLSNYLSNYNFGYNIHLKCESVRQLDASKLAEKNDPNYKISIDFADVQAKLNLGEADIIEVRGWSYVSGIDNSNYILRVVFRSETDGSLFEAPSDAFPREDLEKIFPDERNIKLCGFTSKIPANELPKDTYVIGIRPIWLNDDLTEGDIAEYFILSDNKLTV